jgi:hypothetical protein
MTRSLTELKRILAEDSALIADVLHKLPKDAHHNQILTAAVDVLVSDCPKVKHSIWQVRGSEMNVDILEEGMSSGERLVAVAAISLWTYGFEDPSLWQLMNKLDYRNSRNLILALSIVHYWDAVDRDQKDREDRAFIRTLAMSEH